MPDVPGDSTTSSTIGIGGTINGSLEVEGDRDWYRINLTAGQSISVALNGAGANPLEDPYLRIRDVSGNILYQNDDGGTGRNSMLGFQASYTGTYYIDVGAWTPDSPIADYSTAGDYQLSVNSYVFPGVWTNDQIANQLTTGYWDGNTHHFNVTPGGAITVNMEFRTAAGQNLALNALAMWSDVIGVTFSRVTTGGQIVFDDDQDGASTQTSYQDGVISVSTVNVSTQWLTDYGTGLNSYSFQAYLHEIGHALGLGHAGNYNETATYPFDALYANDGWPASVMSYFAQDESSYYVDRGFTFSYLATPMVSDDIAISQLYGLSTTTRTGNTVYGFNSTADRAVFDATQYPGMSFTIFDSGGTDTLDYSRYGGTQSLDLRPEQYSNVNGRTGTVSIARGVTIENAIGGTGSDTIYGNDAANLLIGSGGNDQIFAGNGDDQVDGGTGADTIDGGQGNDLLVGREGDDLLIGSGGIDNLIGSDGNDKIDGGSGADTLDGGEGNDLLVGREGNDLLLGSGGADNLYGSDGDDRIDGGLGADTLDGGEGNDILVGRENDDLLLGSGGNDYLSGSDGNDRIDGGTGADTLDGGEGNDILVGREDDDILLGSGGADYLIGSDGRDLMDGGSGNDTLDGGNGNDVLNGGGGVDTLIGGPGADLFAFRETGGTTTVSDFVHGVDVIDFTSMDANSGIAGDQTFTFIGSAAFSNVAGQLRAYTDTSVNYVTGDVDGNGTADFLINLGSAQVTGTDIWL